MSPEPRLPITPPACWSMLRPMPRIRGRRYSRCASSTCARARGVVACRSNTFRMTPSRSATGNPAASSRLRACEGVSSASTTSRSAPASRARGPDPLRGPAADESARVGTMELVQLHADDPVALRPDQAGHLRELGLRIAGVAAMLYGEEVAGVALRCGAARRRSGALRGAASEPRSPPSDRRRPTELRRALRSASNESSWSCPRRVGPARGAPSVGARIPGQAWIGSSRSSAALKGSARAGPERAETQTKRANIDMTGGG